MRHNKLYPVYVYGFAIIVIGCVGYLSWHSGQPSKQNDDISVSVDSQLDERAIDVSTTTYKYQNIVFQIVGHFDASTIKIFQDDKLVFSESDGGFYALGSNCPNDASTTNCDVRSSSTFGVDINGDGDKDFVFADVSGGSGAYADYRIFKLSKDDLIKEWMRFDDISGDATFEDLNGDGNVDVEFRDGVFNCWKTGCASSRSGTIILSWNKAEQTYTPNLDLMRKPPPSQNEIAKQVNFYKNTEWCVGVDSHDGGISCSVPWTYAVDLIYSGNATSAKKYLETVWPFVSERLVNVYSVNDEFPADATEKYLENEILLQLKQSTYYRDILTINGGKIF